MTTTLTLLALHGLGGDHHQPLGYLDEAVRSRSRVLAPDLRAHGSCALAESPALLTFQQLAADVEAELEPWGGPIVLLGISLGAGVALELVARGLPGIRALVLVRPAWLWEPNPANLAVFPRIAALLREHGAKAGRDRFVESADYASVSAVSVAAADALAAQFDVPRAVERVARLEALPGSAPRRVSVPAMEVVVLAGERDPVHPMPLAQELAAALSGRLIVVPARYDRPDEHMQAVAQVIRRVVAED